MSRIVLATGGARSGKSAWAQQRAESLGERRVFIATCVPQDAEMRARVARHQELRDSDSWSTVEEPIDLAGALRRASAKFPVALVDCLTVWIGNRMFAAEQRGETLSEEAVRRECRGVLEACAGFFGGVVFVTGEVGLGIVPDNAVARHFRDLLGHCNQTIAEDAGEVVLLVCGQPLRVK
jgi:adenosylcobinamide kinase / adenosylcobinamide-phosphate guanylyltransferase